MLDDKTIVEVANRNSRVIVYTIDDLNGLRRVFQPGETKKVAVEEIRKLSYTTGGINILKKHLQIKNDELIKEIFRKVEPEYFYTDSDIKELLLNGSMDELLDCLDFAPEGVIDLVKKYAIELEINDIAKREAIRKKTGMDITLAIDRSKSEDKEEPKAGKAERRVGQSTTEGGERRTTPKYKVVS